MFEKAFRVLSIAVFAILLVGAAIAGEWRIARSVGTVSVTSGGAQPVSLGSSSSVPDGATVVTGSGGRVLLVRGSESMAVGPNSMVIVPASRNGQTTILQRAGGILFDVDRRRVRHFSVETPNLAAVVKGTDFQVSVSPTQSVAIVHSGIVEVTGLAAGQAVDLTAGQRAGVRGRGPLTLSDPSLQVRQVAPRAPVSLPATTAGIEPRIGTGAAGATVGANSSLSYLHTFPIDKIKIDRSFVSRIDGQDGNGMAILRAIAALSTHLGITLNAEGIETEAQEKALTSIGTDETQGFLYARPQPLKDIEGLISKGFAHPEGSYTGSDAKVTRLYG